MINFLCFFSEAFKPVNKELSIRWFQNSLDYRHAYHKKSY